MEYPPLIPYLVVSNAAAAIDFYKDAFGAVELARQQAGDSAMIAHAHLRINGGSIMLSDDFSEMMGGKSMTPEALGGSPVTLHLQLADVDRFWDRAVAAGATVAMELADQFWGDRYGQVVDPFGHKWSIGQTKTGIRE
jgi:PhnB protein